MNNKICSTCGATIPEGNRYCIECGTAVEQPDMHTSAQPMSENQAQPVFDYPVYQQVTDNQSTYGQEQSYQTSYQQGQQQQNTYQQYSYQQQPKNDSVPGEDSPYQPISVWGYVGIILLMCVPCVGFIFLIVWACGGCRKVNKKNFARAALIVAAIGTLLSVGFGLIFGAVIGTVIENSGLASVFETEDGGFDYDALAAYEAIGDGDFSALADLDDEQLEVLSNISGVEMSDIEELMGEYSNSEYDEYEEEYDDEYYDDEYYDEYEEEYDDEYYQSDFDGWPSDYLPAYPSGDGEYWSPICTVFYDTTAEEMKSYVDTLKSKGFSFEDLYEYDITEEEALEEDVWMGSDGYLYLVMYYEDDTLYIDHSTEFADLDY